MTGIWTASAFLAGAAFGWRMALLACLLALACWMFRRRTTELFVVVLVSASAVLGAYRGEPPAVVSSPAWLDQATGLRGTVDTAPTSTGRSQSFRFAASTVENAGTWSDAAATVCVVAAPLPRVGLGDRLILVGQPEPLVDQSRATRSYLANRGCIATMFARFHEIEAAGSGWRRAFADVRANLGTVLITAAPGDSGALLSGLVTGDDRALREERRDAFLHTGTTHITAVSGSNVALVVAILATVGTAGGWRRHLLWQVAVVGAIWAYAVLVGGEPPVVRAALVASAALLAVRVGRRPDFVTLIFLAAMAMVLIEPDQIRSLSFQLSFAASLGIVLVMTGATVDSPLSGVAAAARASIAAQIATLPVIWVVIGQISLTSLLANLLIAPAIGLAFPLAALAGGAGMIWQPLANVLALPALLCTRVVFAVVDTLGGPRFAMAAVGESNEAMSLVVSGLAVAVILALSPDAQTWFHRTVRLLGFTPGDPALAAGVARHGEQATPTTSGSESPQQSRSPAQEDAPHANTGEIVVPGSARHRMQAIATEGETGSMQRHELSPPEVTLRDVREDDLPIFFQQQRDPEANRMAAFTVPDPDDERAFRARWSRQLAGDAILVKTVVAGGDVAGHVLSYEQMGEREVTYWIGREFWGRGIATRALAAFLEIEQTRPIHARAAKDNEASLTVLRRCGFVITGEDRGFANARGSEVEEYTLIRHG